jgi:hypothetical protein
LRIKGSGSRSFTDDSPTNSKASVCQPCYKNNITYKLEVYTKDPQHFMFCPYCNNIVNKRLMRFESETQPLGYKGGNGPVSFEVEVVEHKRRITYNTNDNEVLDVSQHPLADKEDKDLYCLANQGFVVSVEDSENVDYPRRT